MRKVIFAATLVGILILARGTPPDAVLAQAVQKQVTAGGVIEVTEGKDGKFRFFVRDDAGKLLAMSGPSGFESPDDAQGAIKRLKEVIKTAKVTVKKAGKAAK